MKKQGGARYI